MTPLEPSPAADVAVRALGPAAASSSSSEVDLPSEVLAVAVAGALFLIYTGAMKRSVSRDPLHTTRGTMQAARRAWVRTQLNAGMLPVNTLRDFISSTQFFASSSLLIVVGITGYAASAIEASTLGTRDRRHLLFVAKATSLVALHAFNFAAFSMATRCLCHTSFLINAKEIDGRPVTEQLVFRMLDRATSAWSAGHKGMMMTFPLLLWIFGAVWLVLGMVALLAAQLRYDFGDFGGALQSAAAPVVEEPEECAALAAADEAERGAFGVPRVREGEPPDGPAPTMTATSRDDDARSERGQRALLSAPQRLAAAAGHEHDGGGV